MIKIEELSFSYSKKKKLFDKFNLELKPGNIYGLLGKNGAGKTTLLKLISGLLFPKKGKINLSGINPSSRIPKALNELFFLSEELYSPHLTIKQYEKVYSRFYPKFAHEAFWNYAKEFELLPGDTISQMSYGQKKKLYIAFGLAANTSIVLFDEPTNGLDIPSKSIFRKIISEAALDNRLIIISTHQIRDVDNLIDPLIIIDEGSQLLFEDTFSLSKKYKIVNHSSEPPSGSCYFLQKTPQGFAALIDNDDGSFTGLNLEIVFNALLSSKEFSLIHQKRVK